MMSRVELVAVLRHQLPAAFPRSARKVLILNVRSGSAAASSRELARAARRAGAEVIEVARGTDLQLAVRSRLRDGVRHFIVGGGDGTLRNVIQPLVGSDATIGLIPLGTYNRFARDAGLFQPVQRGIGLPPPGVTAPGSGITSLSPILRIRLRSVKPFACMIASTVTP